MVSGDYEDSGGIIVNLRCRSSPVSMSKMVGELDTNTNGISGTSTVGQEHNQELTAFVQNLLKEMQGRFQTMSDSIVGRIDDMSGRIDDLEKSIGDLMAKAAVDDEDARKD